MKLVKKRLIFGLLIAMLLLTGACNNPTPPLEMISTFENELNREDISGQEIPADKVAIESYAPDYEFDCYYAKTPEYFYTLTEGGLERVLLDDLSQREEIVLSLQEEYNGKKLKKPPYSYQKISGITTEWLFVSMRMELPDDASADYYLVYKVSLDGKEQVILGESNHCAAWFNPANSSLYFVKDKGETVMLEAYDLISGKKEIIFNLNDVEENVYLTRSVPWDWTADGKPLFEVGGTDGLYGWKYLVIDENNQVISASDVDIRFRRDLRDRPTANEAEQQLAQKEYSVRSYVTYNGWVYYAEYVEEAEGADSFSKNLYRMKPDGSENELLQADTPVVQLLTLDNKLYALAGYPVEPADGMDSDLIEFQQLDERGKSLSALEIGDENTDTRIFMCEFESKVLMWEWAIYGGKNFVALYDPATNSIFR